MSAPRIAQHLPCRGVVCLPFPVVRTSCWVLPFVWVLHVRNQVPVCVRPLARPLTVSFKLGRRHHCYLGGSRPSAYWAVGVAAAGLSAGDRGGESRPYRHLSSSSTCGQRIRTFAGWENTAIVLSGRSI